jgi:hypothetical protein
VDVWPDCWPAFDLFAQCRTQWRVAMGGPTGLDYVAVLALMDLHGIKRRKRRKLLDDIQHMEAAALEQMAQTYT